MDSIFQQPASAFPPPALLDPGTTALPDRPAASPAVLTLRGTATAVELGTRRNWVPARCSVASRSYSARTAQPTANEGAMRAGVRSVRAERDTLLVGGQVERSHRFAPAAHTKELPMNRLIYIIGAIVVIVAVLSFFGLR